MTEPRDYAAAIHALIDGARTRLDEAAVGVDALADLASSTVPVAPVAGVPRIDLPNEKALFDAARQIKGKGLTDDDVAVINAAIAAAMLPPPAGPQLGLTSADFAAAATRLGCSVPQIRAVWNVECAGSGWFTDVRADILNLDGPGGFIDGTALPKILFEAHKFSKHTGHRFDVTHPQISSPRWNKALYKGGQAEYARLYEAMKLDRSAALKSASWGGPQILGENYQLAGFASVEAFVDAMMHGERAHLDAFVSFVQKTGLTDELRRVTGKAADCAPFAEGYNGPAYAANGYDKKIAAEFTKESRK